MGEGLLRSVALAEHELGDGDPALVLPIYTRLSDAEETERQRLGLKEPATVALTGVDDVLADIHLQFRSMSVNDLKGVSKLETLTYAGTSHTPWSEKSFYEELTRPDRSWWLAHDHGTPVGFAGGRLAGAEFEIEEVVVDSQRRREGIASKLVERVAYDAQMLGAHTAVLEVAENNESAQKLYEYLGFEKAGIRPGYYAPDVAALLMKADLPLTTQTVFATRNPEPQASIRPWPLVAAKRSDKTKAALSAAGDLVLAIESSCDETAMAIIDSHGVICSNVVATQIDFHARFGGVVPEIASRKHTEAIVGLFEETLARAGEHFGCDTLVSSDLSAIGVTAGPGLVGALQRVFAYPQIYRSLRCTILKVTFWPICLRRRISRRRLLQVSFPVAIPCWYMCVHGESMSFSEPPLMTRWERLLTRWQRHLALDIRAVPLSANLQHRVTPKPSDSPAPCCIVAIIRSHFPD